MSQPPYPPSVPQPDPQMPPMPQQQWAPSAYSAPSTGAYPYGYATPASPSGFGSMFSLNFTEPVAPRIAKPVMILSYIFAAAQIIIGFIFFLYSVSGSNTLNSFGAEGGTTLVFIGILVFALSIVGGLLQIGITRAILDHIVYTQTKRAE